MPQIYPIFPNGFAANSYLVTEDGKQAVCIDPASPRILAEAQRRGLDVKFVLLTHGHFDHVGGCAAFSQTGAKIGCLAAEKALAEEHNLGAEFGMPVPPFRVDFTFSDGDELSLAGMTFQVIATAGHTVGSVCFLLPQAEGVCSHSPAPLGGKVPQAEGVCYHLPAPLGGKVPQAEGGCLYSLFTGDTLFRESVGRTDLPTGSVARLHESLARLCALPFDCKLFPGHGEISTLSYEKTHNGYLKW